MSYLKTSAIVAFGCEIFFLCFLFRSSIQASLRALDLLALVDFISLTEVKIVTPYLN